MDSSTIDTTEELIVSRFNAADNLFDTTIGYIEDIIMEDHFQRLQEQFMEKYYKEFENKEENKLIYTDIHREYTRLIESFLEQQLSMRIPDFQMHEFQQQLISRKSELDGEVFDMLVTFTDFVAFKDMMLDYKAEREGSGIDLSAGFIVRSFSSDSKFNYSAVNQHGAGDLVSSAEVNGEEEPMVEGLTPRNHDDTSTDLHKHDCS